MNRLRLLPKPKPPKGGMFLPDPEGGEIFVSWEDLQWICRTCITAPDDETGKSHYKDDPTYDLRRK